MQINLKNHVESNADMTVSCVPVGDSRASDYGLMKVDNLGQVVQFAEKPRGADLEAMKVDTTLLGLSPQDAAKSPYIASMGVYVFKKDILLKLLKWRYPTSNDFGSEIIPSIVTEHNVQERNNGSSPKDYEKDQASIENVSVFNVGSSDQDRKRKSTKIERQPSKNLLAERR